MNVNLLFPMNELLEKFSRNFAIRGVTLQRAVLVSLLWSVGFFATAQLSTVYTAPPFLPDNGSGGISFEVESTLPVEIKQIHCVFTTGATTATVWMRTGGVEHSPGQVNISTANGWSQVVIGATITGADNATIIAIPFGTTVIPINPNVRYGFFIEGNTRYQTNAVGDPAFLTNGVFTIHVADNASYGGPPPIPSNNPRRFTGGVSYQLSLSGASNDAGVIAVTLPAPPLAPGLHPVNATIRNFGTNVITSANVNWSVNGVLQTVIPWTGTLDTIGGTGSNTSIVSLGTYNFPQGSALIKSWTSSPNGLVDTFNINDTSSIVNSFVSSLSGTYTIGGTGADYATFNAALTDLYSAGLTGPVIFNVASGTYTEQLSFNGNPIGSSTTNTVTFKSATGDSTAVTLQYAALAAADNWVVRFSGTTDVIFRQMTIKATGISNGRVFEMLTGTKRITISNCIIQTDVTSTGTVFSGIYSASGNTGMGLLTVTNNVFIGGYYSIYWYGSSTNRKTGLVVENNIMTDFHYYGVQAYYTDSVFLRYNTATNRTTSSISYALQVYYNSGISEIIGNKVHLQGTSSQYGISSGYKVSTNVTPLLIANNFVSQLGSTGTVYGIYLLTTNYVDVYHNSVRIGNGSATAGRSLFASAGTNLNIMNNSLANFGGGYALYTSSTTNIVNSDYNNLYTTGVNLAYWSANRATLADWQLASSKDANSISTNPQYTSASDLHTTSVAMWQTGTPLVAVPFDIDMQPRNPVTPCIGADEYMLYANDAGIFQMTSPVAPCPGIADVKVKIKNFGIQTFTGATINWSVNGVAQTPFVYTGTLAPGIDQEVLLGTFNFLGGINYDLEFYTTNPGSSLDQNPANDTLMVSGLRTAMSGTFTVGTGTGFDYNTIGGIVSDLTSFGVCGPIVVNIAAGIYTENILLNNIIGTSSTNTITFKSANNDNTSVTVEYSAISAGDNYVVMVTGTSHVKFQHITFQATGTSYGRVFEFMNGANYNEISNCKLLTSLTTSSNFAGIYSTSNTPSNYNVFTNNMIDGGYYGIYWYGTSAAPRKTGITITNNTFTNWYYYGIYVYYTDSATIVNNTISNQPASGICYGIHFGYNNGYSLIDANKVSINGSSTQYGITSYYKGSTPTDYLTISNNSINVTATSAATVNGLYLYYTNYVKAYHNTVNVTGGSATAGRAVYQVGGTNLELQNNIFANYGGGVAYYIGTTSAILSSDFNNYYATATPLAYWGANISDLAALKLANSKDTYSTSANPVFLSPNTNNLIPLSSNIDNLGTPLGILTDVNGVARSLSTPDFGAYEFTGIASDMAIEGGYLAPGQCLSSNDSLYLKINNAIGSQVNFATATLTIYWNVTGPVNSSGTIVVNSGTLDPGITMTVGETGVNMSIPGVYTLSGYLGASSTNIFAGNDTIHHMGNVTIYDPFYVQPDHIFIGNTIATVPITAKSTFFPGGAFYISEICQYKYTTGAPASGWPSWLTAADDYIEITGVPNSDLAGITLEQWNTSGLANSYTFPAGTILGPNGTAIIAVGENSSSVPSPANYFYHGILTTTWSSSTASGRILKDNTGAIIDAVGYSGFTFPAASNVTAADWSNTLSGGSSTSGIRLIAPDNNTGSSWAVTSSTILQDPNTVNTGTTVPPPASLTGFTWSHNSVVFATNVIDTTVGPWTTSGVYHYIASYVTPCGTLTDTVSVHVLLANVTGDTIICENDTAMISISLPGTGPWTIIASDGTGVDTLTVATSPFVFYVAPSVTTTYTLVKFADASNVFVNANLNHTVNVTPAPAVTLGAFSAVCASDPAIMLSGGLPAGGNYSGTSVAAGVFNPSMAGPGTHLIAYTYVDLTTGCAATAAEQIVVGAGPAISITADHDICPGDATTLEVILPGGAAPTMIFSEYIEGTSNNKAIEIFNATPDTLDLDNYRIGQATNGGGWAYWHTFPAGAKLAPHTTWVMVANQVSATYYDTALADQVLAYPSVVHHNGDDARSVEVTTDGGLTWTIIDIIGDPGNDPGTGWPVAGVNNATADKTLIRKPEIFAGNTNWPAVAGTDSLTSEYTVFPVNTFSNLGSHTFVAPPVVSVTYAWSNSATTPTITVNPSVTTTYTVTVTDAVTSCATVESVVVTVLPAPAVALGPDFDVCDDKTATIDAGAGFASYLWSTGATTQTILVDGAIIGLGNTVTYTVTVTNTAGCEGIDAVNVTAINCIGIDELDVNNALTFWPNPNEGNFFVRIKGISGDVTLQITNVAGQMISTEQLTLNGELVKAINLGNLAPGIYLIRMQTKSDVITKQVIIK